MRTQIPSVRITIEVFSYSFCKCELCELKMYMFLTRFMQSFSRGENMQSIFNLTVNDRNKMTRKGDYHMHQVFNCGGRQCFLKRLHGEPSGVTVNFTC